MTKAALKESKSDYSTNDQVLYMALELSKNKWKIAFGRAGRIKIRMVNVDGGCLEELKEEMMKAKERFELPEDCQVVSCYEAGRDGFYIHRYLQSIGVKNIVVDSASIEVNRRARRNKTDRLDAKKLLSMLKRHSEGERGVWSIVRVPDEQSEDDRMLHREMGRLNKERNGHINRIKGLLFAQGIRTEKVRHLSAKALDDIRLWNGKGLLPGLKSELKRELERLYKIEEQMDFLVKEQLRQIKEASTPQMKMVVQLMLLRGIGRVSAWLLVMEFFGWRKFNNGRELGALAGLTGTPYNSGGVNKEQGISKAGNRWVRAVMIELAWGWVRYQPGSALTQWFDRRFAGGGKRMRKRGIVAVARKLLLDLWKYLDMGVVPEGAELQRSRAA